MNLLLDTNIILNLIRAKNFFAAENFVNPQNSLTYISVVSEAEINSISIRNNWGTTRKNSLADILDYVDIIEINQSFVSTYAEIDAYSQRLNPNFESYPFDTPRNMGKNDLWIASLATLSGLKLVTTDSDFDHLHNIFFEVRKIEPSEFVPFF